MDRRTLIRALGAAAVAPLLVPLSPAERLAAAEALHARAGRDGGGALDARQLALVTALSDSILPRTDTPSASDVGVPAFVDLLLAEWYPAGERDSFIAGLQALDARCRAAHGTGFADAASDTRAAFLETVDGRPGEPASAEGAFRQLKALTIYGYFTSRPVAVDVLHVRIIPGRYDGCVPS